MGAEWTPELTVDDEALDRQHLEIFRRLRDAAAALERGPVDADAAMGALGDALMEHLAFEEQRMEETLYPERTRHRAAHELFIADFVQMRDELRARGITPEVSDWLNRRIADWLRYHIRVNDIPLGEYLARRRGQPDEGGVRRRDGRWQS